MCISCSLLSGSQYQCYQLRKTHLNDRLCVEWDIKRYTLTHWVMLIITRSTDGEGKCISQMIMSGYEWENRNVLRWCLKTTGDGADVTWGGRSFHVLAPETGKARLPTVERWIDSTANARRWEAEDATVVYTSHPRDDWNTTLMPSSHRRHRQAVWTELATRQDSFQ